jgi:hypothetical protein
MFVDYRVCKNISINVKMGVLPNFFHYYFAYCLIADFLNNIR